jgi:hypothetical protein
MFFSQLPVGGNGIDFRGFKIDSIALRLDLLDISSPGINPNGNGIWTDCSYSGQISVNYEPVPEPATTVLTAIFALLLGIFGKHPRAQQRNPLSKRDYTTQPGCFSGRANDASVCSRPSLAARH